jgi:hypothetical protein
VAGGADGAGRCGINSSSCVAVIDVLLSQNTCIGNPVDLAASFHKVLAIANEAADPESGWSSLKSYLRQQAAMPLSHLEQVDVAADVRNLQAALRLLTSREPIPEAIDTLYFGLFDAVNDRGDEEIGYYISGVAGFSPDNGDTLCRPLWWPENRYLESAMLHAIKQAEVLSRDAGDENIRSLLGYAGQLGAAALLSRFASRIFAPKLHRVVGFDSGDFAEVFA